MESIIVTTYSKKNRNIKNKKLILLCVYLTCLINLICFTIHISNKLFILNFDLNFILSFIVIFLNILSVSSLHIFIF